MFKAQKDFNLSQGALAVSLVLKRADLLNGHTYLVLSVIGRTGLLKKRETNKKLQLNTNGKETYIL